MFYSQLKTACRDGGTSVTGLLKKLKLSTANTGKWKSGSMPSVDVLLRLATELNVSIDYLLGRTDNPMVATPTGANLHLVEKERQDDVPSGDVINKEKERNELEMGDKMPVQVYLSDILTEMPDYYNDLDAMVNEMATRGIYYKDALFFLSKIYFAAKYIKNDEISTSDEIRLLPRSETSNDGEETISAKDALALCLLILNNSKNQGWVVVDAPTTAHLVEGFSKCFSYTELGLVLSKYYSHINDVMAQKSLFGESVYAPHMVIANDERSHEAAHIIEAYGQLDQEGKQAVLGAITREEIRLKEIAARKNSTG